MALNYIRRKVRFVALLNNLQTQIKIKNMRLALIA